jgi:hypothetical protein
MATQLCPEQQAWAQRQALAQAVEVEVEAARRQREDRATAEQALRNKPIDFGWPVPNDSRLSSEGHTWLWWCTMKDTTELSQLRAEGKVVDDIGYMRQVSAGPKRRIISTSVFAASDTVPVERWLLADRGQMVRRGREVSELTPLLHMDMVHGATHAW